MQNHKIIIFICLIFFLSGCRDITPLSSNEDDLLKPNIIDEPYDLDEPYDFPLRAGMPEWAELKTHVEMLNALQVPQDILNRMTTKSLVETCLNYPMFLDILFYDTPKTGMEILIDNYFNGFTELLKREYAYTFLSERFISFDPLAINEEWSLVEKGGYKFELIKIELLLGQDIVLEYASYESKISLLKEALLKYEKLLTQKEYYSSFDHGQILFLMGKILLKSGNPNISSLVINNKEISYFLETGRAMSYDIAAEILSIANRMINTR
jgi:hypothetical protein